MIVVDALPGGTLDPSVDRSLPLDRQTGSVVGIDATFPLGAEIRTAGARPVSRDICGPALAEKGHEYIEVADVPGRREYEFPELKGRSRQRRTIFGPNSQLVVPPELGRYAVEPVAQ